MILKVTHNGGFFSCCTMRLGAVLTFFNQNRKLPKGVDSSRQFLDYKINRKDVTSLFFAENKDIDIPFVEKVQPTSDHREWQFSDYKKINFSQIKPFIDKYFYISNNIKEKQSELIKKYNLNLDNCCGILYRGNDKSLETQQPNFSEMIDKATVVHKKNKNVQFIVQTDELDFLREFEKSFPTCISFSETIKIPKTQQAIHHVTNKTALLLHTQYYVSAITILSQCNSIITTSGNGEFFMMLYRGHAKNVIQYLRPLKEIYKVENPNFDSSQKYFWID